jgi:hypothetical protein
MDAAKRLEQALEKAGKTRDQQDEQIAKGHRKAHHVELDAADIVAVADGIHEPDELAKALRKGAAESPAKTVVIESAHAFALLDQVGRKKAKDDKEEKKAK